MNTSKFQNNKKQWRLAKQMHWKQSTTEADGISISFASITKPKI